MHYNGLLKCICIIIIYNVYYNTLGIAVNNLKCISVTMKWISIIMYAVTIIHEIVQCIISCIINCIKI